MVRPPEAIPGQVAGGVYAMPPMARFGQAFACGTPTGLAVKHMAVSGELVQAFTLVQPRLGGEIAIPARKRLDSGWLDLQATAPVKTSSLIRRI